MWTCERAMYMCEIRPSIPGATPHHTMRQFTVLVLTLYPFLSSTPVMAFPIPLAPPVTTPTFSAAMVSWYCVSERPCPKWIYHLTNMAGASAFGLYLLRQQKMWEEMWNGNESTGDKRTGGDNREV